MTRTFLLFGLLLTSILGFSQTDVVITLQGDSITGKASITSNKGNAIQTVILKNGREKQQFKAYEVKILLRGDKVYHTYKLNGKYQLGLLVKEGYLSIYKFMDSETASSNEFSSSVLIKKDGSQLMVPNIGFKKHVENFLNDCETVAKGFEKNTYKKSDLEKIVDDYNDCINKNTKSLNSQKAEINLQPDKVDKIDVLIKAIKEDGNLPELDSILEMLNDLKSKVKEGTKIPTYLQNALHDSLKSNEKFTKQLNQILE